MWDRPALTPDGAAPRELPRETTPSLRQLRCYLMNFVAVTAASTLPAV